MARTTVRLAPLAVLALPAVLLTGCEEKIVSQIDETPPEAAVSSPADGSDVSGVAFQVDVTATDDVGVDEVRFRVNGGSTVSDTVPPYAATVVTLPEAAGSNLLVQVEVLDTAGNATSVSATYRVGSRTVTRLTNHPNSDMNPAWSPDGSRIVFQAKRAGGQFDLWTMNADGTNQAEMTADVNEDRNPAWSPDGNWIAFDSDRAGTFDLWLLPVVTGESGASSVTFGNNDDMQPAWEPGGAYLYFASNRGTSTPYNIWMIPAVGTDADAVQVTSFNNPDTAPAVSADGSRLAFASTLNFSTAHIYTMPIGTTSVTPLTGALGFTETDPAWAPGTDLVVFSRDDGVDSNLWLKGTAAQAAAQATFGSGTLGDGGAAWSPQGSKLAFHSDRDGNLEIYVVE